MGKPISIPIAISTPIKELKTITNRCNFDELTTALYYIHQFSSEGTMNKCIYLLLFFSVFFFCENSTNSTTSSEEKEIIYQLESTFLKTSAVRYETKGGGDIDFKVYNREDSILCIVSRLNFKEVNDSIVLADKQLSDTINNTLTQLFKGTVDIGGTIYAEEGETGSWTNIYVMGSDDNWLRVANNNVINDITRLRFYLYE